MAQFDFKGILTENGWIENASISTDEQGNIESITQSSANKINSGFLIPGFQNAHSHAFQYGMAGLAEIHATGTNPDDFWSWRDAMYRLALQLNPDEMESIATMLYAEMVRVGYTNVAEFHYLHHDTNGQEFDNLAEMGQRLISAAKRTGIHITLIPIFYQKGGFGKAPNEGQKRFISKDIETYLRLLESSREACKYYDHANVALGIHSMRGVEPSAIAEIAKSGPQDLPFHIHIAEQLKEIEDSVEYLGMRPVEWLSANVELNERFHLVHATHLTEGEVHSIAQSKANVVLCPTTEGNLGDGLFPLREFQRLNGQWSIGTDSHIGLHPLEELRLLDYGQRLITHKRNTFAGADGDSGRFAIEQSLIAGRKAMNNFNTTYFKIGEPLNGCVIDSETPLLSQTSAKNRTSTLVYTCDASHNMKTIISGKEKSIGIKHVDHDNIRSTFNETISKLKNR